MSANLLRRAAILVRTRAVRATPDAWKVWGMSVRADAGHDSDVDKALLVAHTHHEAGLRTFNADYIAMMDPRVGAAVADCLARATYSAEAAEYAASQSSDAVRSNITPVYEPAVLDLITLARLVLGESS
jgi:hypothetical protein